MGQAAGNNATAQMLRYRRAGAGVLGGPALGRQMERFAGRLATRRRWGRDRWVFFRATAACLFTADLHRLHLESAGLLGWCPAGVTIQDATAHGVGGL